ncbi:hypothetical protein CC78DRAFT_620722 [Lojkania enalia]|uniref:Uncharacterized protein n=1 Tax=Lojkania enalia TaxID=147567 RepID=A0A9P4JZJ5_9PLEO|nr:hypothetical protein CC78DRAFT_620722 [Didymosphaeria enalia]
MSLITVHGIEMVVNKNNTNDVHEYIHNLFLKDTHEPLRTINKDIISYPNSTFLWASLVASRMIKAFAAGKTVNKLQAMLDDIRDKLDNLFSRIFNDTNFTAEQWDDLQHIARLVLRPMRPLSIEELYAALMLQDSAPD